MEYIQAKMFIFVIVRKKSSDSSIFYDYNLFNVTRRMVFVMRLAEKIYFKFVVGFAINK